MKVLAIIAVASILAACTATMVNAPGDASSEFAPVNEQARGGVIKYLNQGADSVIKSRRQDAYEQMHGACHGKYRIDAEGPRVEGGLVQAVSPQAAISSNIEYWHIQFSCVQ